MNVIHFPDPKVHPQWKLLVEHFGDIDHNILLRHDELAVAMDMPPLSRMDEKGRRLYYAQVKKFSRFMLRDRNIYLETIPNQGYRAVCPNEHKFHSLRKARQGTRRYAEAVQIVTHTNVESLSQKEVSELALIQARIGAVHASMKNEVQELRKAIALPEKKQKMALPGAVV